MTLFMRDLQQCGAHELHLAVWSGNTSATRRLLERKASPNVMDNDGQTPWAWAEAKNNEPMLEILREYGGGPSPVWSLKAEPTLDAMLLVCTNLGGETVFSHRFTEEAPVADVVKCCRRETGASATFILPNNHVIGLSDHHLTIKELLDSPPCTEKRKDPHDGHGYTKREFFKYYGSRKGQEMWDKAIPDEEVAYAESWRRETAMETNAMISEAVLRSRHEHDESNKRAAPITPPLSNVPGMLGVADSGTPSHPPNVSPSLVHHEGNGESMKAMVLHFNKHPAEFKEAIHESAVAQNLIKRGIDISPEWANGAKILIEGLTPSMIQESGFQEQLQRWHVVVCPENEKDVMESLLAIRFRKRPKLKTQTPITCQKLPVMRSACAESSHQDKHEAAVAEEADLTEESQLATSIPEEFRVTRTFIDVCKSHRVGWSPRSAYTKSSNDRHGIENPREWT
mmetsp:Transcript_14201/g.28102  ORF Transcript_14201/g.28102 Transcript_14201/m.28102 type:complete len:455 (-) Transcript_14201:157-1521(-)|eukprot:CAMPEP_0172728638 /NCGR_PEP_ID=MMETSP1074-20121228/92354_1 /TAXON_ID=2916 /ORGANISM="Ceratium fusus, Strain PA161109" /LENGTH=454 /DNA_ID=CAMNT_0013555907 /DNA_START=132 /DNA_END=1496 /DNA_ORIENTATION=+